MRPSDGIEGCVLSLENCPFFKCEYASLSFKWSCRRSESRKQNFTNDPKCTVIERCCSPAVPAFQEHPPIKGISGMVPSV